VFSTAARGPESPSGAPAHDDHRREPGLRQELDGRLTRVGARGRLECEIRAIARDLIGTEALRQCGAEAPEFVDRRAEAAVAVARDAALASLRDEIERLLLGLAPDVVRRLDQARSRADAGIP
jgi:hypothetical protein